MHSPTSTVGRGLRRLPPDSLIFYSRAGAEELRKNCRRRCLAPEAFLVLPVETFRSSFVKRSHADASAPPVLLWPDTFNNYFHPQTAMAAAQVLEAAGFSVRLPKKNLCCGRPLYDFGMLDRAKKLLLQTLATLEAEIAEGIPVVVLEPSCASVFRDEMLNFFPDDIRAQKLAGQVMLLSEFLEKHGQGILSCRSSSAKLWFTATVITNPIMKMNAEESFFSAWGSNIKCRPRAVAAWRAHLALKKKI